jgi:type IV pilus assembly protein PilB
MADVQKTTPKQPLKGLGGESAARAGNALQREAAATPGAAQPGMDQNELRKWMQQVDGNESAARMGHDLIETGLMSGGDFLETIAADMGMERIDLSTVQFSPELIQQLEINVAKKYGALPVDYNAQELWVAISDPHNVQVLDDLSRISGKHVHGKVAREDEIEKYIKKFYEPDDYTALYNDMTESDDPGFNKWDEVELSDTPEIEQPAVVKFVDKLFRLAVHERASDIHVEPNRMGVGIRFRIDGVLHEVVSPPRKWQNAIISRLKVLAGLDLAEKRVPLDGRIRLSMPEKKLDLRVSTLPTIFGESIVMRLLDPANVMIGLEDVGFLPETIKIFHGLIKSPNGVILMTGPTGSGKTTTLYAALGVLNTPEHKLVTLEDPVEYMIPGINQIQIHQEIGLGFPEGLKAVLRQSPDIILVGEIRDKETAENAIRAALTGHLVFSTLHTNDAPSSTVRLIDMGMKPYLVASSLQAAIAQRLVRRICSACKESYHPHPEEIREAGYDPDEYADIEFFKGKGCERCNQSGYRGRTAIHETMVMDADLRRRVIRSEPATRLKKAAVSKGMRTLRMDGFQKSILGWTTIEEILRITAADT